MSVPTSTSTGRHSPGGTPAHAVYRFSFPTAARARVRRVRRRGRVVPRCPRPWPEGDGVGAALALARSLARARLAPLARFPPLDVLADCSLMFAPLLPCSLRGIATRLPYRFSLALFPFPDKNKRNAHVRLA